MTDARYPERWLNDRRLLRLSGDDHSAFVRALAWSVANRTDGVIEFGDLKLIPDMTDATSDALVKAELWKVIDGGERFHIVDYEETQTSRDELEILANERRRNREAKRRERARKAAAQADVRGTVYIDSQADVSGDAPRTGQARTGQATYATNYVSVDDEKIDDNPTSREFGDWFAAGADYEPPPVDCDGFPLDGV